MMNEKVETIIQKNEAIVDQMPTPIMNVTPPMPITRENDLISNVQMSDLYMEILSYCREDRLEAKETFDMFLNMVVNDGDASMASKQACVDLLKLKSDISDKMSKVMDLLMRSLLKDKNTTSEQCRYINAQQENKFIFKDSTKKREFLEKFNKGKNNIEK